MSCWASNTTWLEPKGPNPPKKRVNECAMSHREPAMTRWASNTTWHEPKGPNPRKKRVNECAMSHREPAMTRWASNTTWHEPKGTKSLKKGAKEHATSHWVHAMSRWASNTTWLHPKGTKTPKKGAKRARHVALGARHVALGLQRDVARVPRFQNPQNERVTSYWGPAMSRWTFNATWLPNFRLHHTETGTDKRWRNHFGSRRGGLCGVGGNI